MPARPSARRRTAVTSKSRFRREPSGLGKSHTDCELRTAASRKGSRAAGIGSVAAARDGERTGGQVEIFFAERDELATAEADEERRCEHRPPFGREHG